MATADGARAGLNGFRVDARLSQKPDVDRITARTAGRSVGSAEGRIAGLRTFLLNELELSGVDSSVVDSVRRRRCANVRCGNGAVDGWPPGCAASARVGESPGDEGVTSEIVGEGLGVYGGDSG